MFTFSLCSFIDRRKLASDIWSLAVGGGGGAFGNREIGTRMRTRIYRREREFLVGRKFQSNIVRGV